MADAGHLEGGLGADPVGLGAGLLHDLGGLRLGGLQQGAGVPAQPGVVGGVGRGGGQGEAVLGVAQLADHPGELGLHLADIGVDRSAVIAPKGVGEISGGRGGLLEQVQALLVGGW